jgi:hypothetical protein
VWELVSGFKAPALKKEKRNFWLNGDRGMGRVAREKF